VFDESWKAYTEQPPRLRHISTAVDDAEADVLLEALLNWLRAHNLPIPSTASLDQARTDVKNAQAALASATRTVTEARTVLERKLRRDLLESNVRLAGRLAEHSGGWDAAVLLSSLVFSGGIIWACVDQPTSAVGRELAMTIAVVAACVPVGLSLARRLPRSARAPARGVASVAAILAGLALFATSHHRSEAMRDGRLAAYQEINERLRGVADRISGPAPPCACPCPPSWRPAEVVAAPTAREQEERTPPQVATSASGGDIVNSMMVVLQEREERIDRQRARDAGSPCPDVACR
jgi:hypothetical protein